MVKKMKVVTIFPNGKLWYEQNYQFAVDMVNFRISPKWSIENNWKL